MKNRPKSKTKIAIIFLLLIAGWVIVMATGQYHFPGKRNIEKRLNYIERAVTRPFNPGEDIWRLKRENYEFVLFSYAFSTYAATNIAIRDTTYRKDAAALISRCIERVLDSRVAAPYGVESPLYPADSMPPHSVLYLGHVNLMLGCYRLLAGDSDWNKLHDAISNALFQRYNDTEHLLLESYTSSIWIPDNTVAIASLKLHSAITGSEYDSICSRWVQYVKTNYMEEETQVLYSTVNAQTGKPKEEPRGSMLGWSIMFIYQFDSEFAAALYERYKKHFSSDYLVFRLFKERHNSSETHAGDMDSGPVFRGYSIPANAFALSNSIIAEDYKTAKKIERLIRFGARQINRKNETRYKVRFVEMHISPMAEAIVLFSMTIVKWTE